MRALPVILACAMACSSASSNGNADSADDAADGRASADGCRDRTPAPDQVLFHENFEQEGFSERWPKFWNEAPGPRTIGSQHGRSLILFATPREHPSRGGGEWAPYTAPGDGLDRIYLRMRTKLEEAFTLGRCEQLKLFSINAGATIEQTYGGAGEPPNGRDKASVFIAVDNDLRFHFYTYFPEQNEGYGQIDTFDVDGDVELEPGHWTEIEILWELNTPGRHDGRIRAWIDRRLRGDLSRIRFRDVDDVKIRRFEILNYFGGDGPSNTSPRSQGALYDDVLVASEGVCP